MPLASLLGLLFASSEAALAFFKRAQSGAAGAADRGSLRLLWVVIVLSVIAAFFVAAVAPGLGFGPAAACTDLGIVLVVAGLAIRWYAIVYLGRFFTVNVAIADDHRLIDTGPYRFVRHPSYTGALLAFFGLGLCLCNWAALALMCLPTLLAFVRRMHIEEGALTAAFGEQYRVYMQRTKRLIPAIY